MGSKLIPITEKEMANLLRTGVTVTCAFGPGGAALEWPEGEPMPDAVRQVGLMRGILNRNMDGAGI